MREQNSQGKAPGPRPVGLWAAAVLGLGVWAAAGTVLRADPPAPPMPPAPTATPDPVETSKRVVAYIYGTTPITRADLGEYLIARTGVEKLELLVNKRIIESACAQKHVDVTPEEVEAAFADDAEGFKIKPREFVRMVMERYGKTEYEWKQDVIRPRLLLCKLCRDKVRVTEDDLRKVFENRYGPRVKCKMILWTAKRSGEAVGLYEEIRKGYAAFDCLAAAVGEAAAQLGRSEALRQGDEAFDRAARAQETAALAAAGGDLSPIARHCEGESNVVEEEAFKLRPGELSRLFTNPKNGDTMVLKCVAVIPGADKDFEKEKPALLKEVIDRRVSKDIPKIFEALRAQAKPQIFKDRLTKPGESVLATFDGLPPVTREELGEFLVVRYGADRLELLVNRRIIEHGCAGAGVTVTQQEVDAAYKEDAASVAASFGIRVEDFATLLKQQGKTEYEWKEDVLRPKLLMGKLCREQIKIGDDDLREMFEHLYGTKMRAKIIIWRPGEEKIALKKYDEIRHNDEAFDRAARSQANSTLAAKEGEVAPIGRPFGPPNPVEEAVFKLQPKEVSRLLTTKEGTIVVKCLGPLPAEKKDFEKERPALTKAVFEWKLARQGPEVFKKLREQANPQMFLQTETRATDVEDAVRREVGKDLEPKPLAPMPK